MGDDRSARNNGSASHEIKHGLVSFSFHFCHQPIHSFFAQLFSLQENPNNYLKPCSLIQFRARKLPDGFSLVLYWRGGGEALFLLLDGWHEGTKFALVWLPQEKASSSSSYCIKSNKSKRKKVYFFILRKNLACMGNGTGVLSMSKRIG